MTTRADVLEHLAAKNPRTDPNVCIAVVDGCTECTAQDAARDHDVCDDLCAMWQDLRADPDGHTLSHAPIRCDGCGAVVDDRRGNRAERQTVCRGGRCTVVLCAHCGHELWSDGPVGCPWCAPEAAVAAEVAALHRAAAGDDIDQHGPTAVAAMFADSRPTPATRWMLRAAPHGCPGCEAWRSRRARQHALHSTYARRTR